MKKDKSISQIQTDKILHLLLLLPVPEVLPWFGDSGRFPELEGLATLYLSGPSKELAPGPPF